VREREVERGRKRGKEVGKKERDQSVEEREII